MDSSKKHSISLLDAKNVHTINMVDAINDSLMIAVTDTRGKILSVNDKFCEVLQYSPEELIGETHQILNSGYHTSIFFEDLWNTVMSGKAWSGEMCDRAKDGNLCWLKTTIIPFNDEDGQPFQFIIIRTDITDQRNMPHLKFHHPYDELTRLGNGRSLDMYFQECLDGYKVTYRASAIIMVNLSRLKQINDGFGRAVGDLFILEVVKKVQAILGTKDNLFRYKGKKLIITTNEKRSALIIEQIIAIFNAPFVIEDIQFYSNVHIGVAYYEKHAVSLEGLIKCAELAVVESLKEKGNKALVFEEHMTTIFEEKIDLENRLRAAVYNNQLMLYYQPKFEAVTHRLVGMEALLRWYDEDYGFIPPDKFIPVAEETGLMPVIDEWVLMTACMQMKQWTDLYADLSLRVAVNISPQHLQEQDFVYTVKQILTDTALAPKHLEIEITETSFINGTDFALRSFQQLKDLGVSIAIDDFGTGYSSLGYLKQFPIHTLKIDKSFVRGIKPNTVDASMVTAIIHLAHIMKMAVVVEGVETIEELNVIECANGDMIQGYYFSPALCADEFENTLKKAPK